tara:strand:- start:259 stop:957 length:699 start_codon:yes stop_codon:yes gene_type:complete
MIISLSENGNFDEAIYRELRSYFISSSVNELLPSFIRTCRDSGALWGYLKKIAHGSGSWQIRREHVYESFQKILNHLENRTNTPSDEITQSTLQALGSEDVRRIWEKALKRRKDDPEGAITIARTLLESVCKLILDAEGIQHKDDDLPKLYSKTSEILKLAPSQHEERTFKAILGGCHTVVQNLGTLRNKIGDAHGQGKIPVRPAPRHAALAVNLAGTMATFLADTYQNNSE